MRSQVLDLILTRGDAIDFEERGIERLTVGESNHIRDILHIQVLIAAVYQERHSLLDAVLIDIRGVVHVKTHVHDSRDVARVGSQILSELLSGVVFVLILFLDDDDVVDFFLQLIHEFGTDKRAIGSFLFFLFCDVVLCHNIVDVMVNAFLPCKINKIILICKLSRFFFQVVYLFFVIFKK